MARSVSRRVELLTNQFYDWERRGRGWDLWTDPVEPEPRFVPFEFHWVPGPLTSIDDGHRPTLASRLVDRLKGVFSGTRGLDSRVDEQPVDESEPEPCDHEGNLAELEIVLPPSFKAPPGSIAQLLRALPHTEHPISFEVIGTERRISLQFTCQEAQADLLHQQIAAHCPDASVHRVDGYLRSLWKCHEGHEQIVVGFGLANEFMLPLRIPRGSDLDPLTGVLGSLSLLQVGELGILQILFQPVHNNWIQSIHNAIHDDSGGPFFLDAPEFTILAKEKTATPLFASVLRVAVGAGDLERVWQIASSLRGALQVFDHPSGNTLIPLAPEDYDTERHLRDMLARRSCRSGMLLNCDELTALVHLPSHAVKLEKLARAIKRTRSLPDLAIGNRCVLGTNSHAGRHAEVTLSPEQRLQHMYVIGASGTGKSTMLLKMILQDLEAGEGLAVLDPHGDLIDDVLHRMPGERIKDVVLVDPADDDFPVGLNVLSAHTELERTLLESDLVAVFRRLSTSWGDQMTSVLSNAILAILESDCGGTLLDLRRFLVEKEFRNEYLRNVRDPNVVYYWQKEFPLLAHKPQAPILTRLNTFLRPKRIRNMVAQKESRLDVAAVMNEGKVLLARLAQGAIGAENSYLLGTLLVAKMQQTAMSRQEQAAEKRRRFYCYIDEFHNFTTPTMESILSGTRKYGLGLVLAHQDLQQIAKSPGLLNAVLTNPYTRICFRVGDHDARSLESGFANFDRSDLQTLSRGEVIARVERSDFDFNMQTEPLPPHTRKSSREAIVAHSRQTYARPREDVEAIVQTAIGTLGTQKSPVRAPTKEVAEPDGRTSTRLQEATPRAIRHENLPAAPQPAIGPREGRGGTFHRYFQGLVKKWAESHEWRATVEESVLGGNGIVDVALRKGELSVACEIAVTTTPAHELENIQKCITAGFDHVALTSPEKKTVNMLRHLVQDELPEAIRARVHVTRSEELLAVLENLDAQVASTQGTIRGYRVTTSFRQLSASEKEERRRAISRVIAKGIKRGKRPD